MDTQPPIELAEEPKIEEPKLRQIIIETEGNLQVAVQRLIDLANARGGKDNVTVILVRAEEPSWKS